MFKQPFVFNRIFIYRDLRTSADVGFLFRDLYTEAV